MQHRHTGQQKRRCAAIQRKYRYDRAPARVNPHRSLNSLKPSKFADIGDTDTISDKFRPTYQALHSILAIFNSVTYIIHRLPRYGAIFHPERGDHGAAVTQAESAG